MCASYSARILARSGASGKKDSSMALNLTILNDFRHTGEISAIKGLQGAVGYKE
jgi:hypothetical protein